MSGMSRSFLSFGRILTLMSIGAGVLITAFFFTPKLHSAFALQAQKPVDWSFYITSSSTSAAYNLGCNQGHYDANLGNINSAVVLDFGMQTSSGSYDFSNAYLSYAQIEAVAEEFSHGYWACTGSDATSVLDLGIGTSNWTNGVVTYSAGQAWANAVNAAENYNQSQGYSSQVTLMGADDIEPSWHDHTSTINWVNGYASVGGSLYMDYGSADGCSTSSASNSSCNNGWTQDNEWYVSWGASPAVPTPEIYNSSMAWQWQKISLYGALSHGSRLNIWAPWDENSGDYNTTQAWNALWNDLNSDSRTAQDFLYSMEIHRQ